MRQTEFIVILDHFLPFYPNSNQQNQNFEKNEKKPPGDIIILQMCTMRYGAHQTEFFPILELLLGNFVLKNFLSVPVFTETLKSVYYRLATTL